MDSDSESDEEAVNLRLSAEQEVSHGMRRLLWSGRRR